MHSNGVQWKRRWEVDDDYNITYKRSTYTRNHLSIHDWCGTYNNIQKRLNWVLQRIRTMVRRHFIHCTSLSISLPISLSLSLSLSISVLLYLYTPQYPFLLSFVVLLPDPAKSSRPYVVHPLVLSIIPCIQLQPPHLSHPSPSSPRLRCDNRTEKLVK